MLHISARKVLAKMILAIGSKMQNAT